MKEVEVIKERLEEAKKLQWEISRMHFKLLEINRKLAEEIARHYRNRIEEIVRSVAREMGFGVRTILICSNDEVKIVIIPTERLYEDEEDRFVRVVEDELMRRIREFADPVCRPSVVVHYDEEFWMERRYCY